MLSFLTTLAVMASNATGGSCAAISNWDNQVAWKKQERPVRSATYQDAGDHVIWSKPVPSVAKMALRTLSVGKPGFKVRLACNYWVVFRR